MSEHRVPGSRHDGVGDGASPRRRRSRCPRVEQIPGAAQPLVDAGATLVDAPGDALAVCLSVSMLADDTAAEGVLDTSAVSQARGIHINMARSARLPPTGSRERFHANGADYVAAPAPRSTGDRGRGEAQHPRRRDRTASTR